jgi:hypothetical protein
MKNSYPELYQGDLSYSSNIYKVIQATKEKEEKKEK